MKIRNRKNEETTRNRFGRFALTITPILTILIALLTTTYTFSPKISRHVLNLNESIIKDTLNIIKPSIKTENTITKFASVTDNRLNKLENRLSQLKEMILSNNQHTEKTGEIKGSTNIDINKIVEKRLGQKLDILEAEVLVLTKKTLENSNKEINNRLAVIEKVITVTPEKALELPFLKRDLVDIKKQLTDLGDMKVAQIAILDDKIKGITNILTVLGCGFAITIFGVLATVYLQGRLTLKSKLKTPLPAEDKNNEEE